MNQEQNNTQNKMDTTEVPELTNEELNEVINEIEENNYWNSCFEQLERMKIHQMKYKQIDIDKFDKKYKQNNQPVDKLTLYKDSFRTSLHYYSDLSNYLRLAEFDNTDALMKYKYYQRRLRELQTYVELSNKFKKEKPSWEGYHKWNDEFKKRNNKRREEKKAKKEN